MSDEEIARGVQAMPELLDQAFLLGFIEIDHHVAAEDDVVAAGQELGFEVVKVKLHKFFQLRLDGVLAGGLFEIAETAGVIHGFHLRLGVEAFLADAKAGVADIGSDDFHFPGRWNQRFRGRHIKRERIPQIIISEGVANQNRDGVGLLPGGTTGAPDAQSVIAAFLFAAKQILKNGFLKKVELGTIAKETRFVDGEVFEQEGQLRASFPAGQQAVIGIEGVELAGLQAALETVFQEMGTALVEKHAAFLVDEGLEKLELCFGKLNLGGDRSHGLRVRRIAKPAGNAPFPEERSLGGGDGFRDLLESFELRAVQELGNVQQDDEAALQLPYAGDVARFALSEDRAGGFDFGGRNFQHFRGGVDNEPDQFVFQFDDQDAVLFIVLNFDLAETFAKVHHRNDFAAQVYDALDQFRGAGNSGDLRNADDFPYGSDADAIGLIPDPEANHLKILFHRRVSGALGTGQFGVFEFPGTVRIRATTLAIGIPGVLAGRTIKNEAIHAVQQIAGELEHLLGGRGKLR